MSRDVPPRRYGQPAEGQRVVRASHLAKQLDAYDSEVGAKLTAILGNYHLKYVQPLEQRIAYLEAPPWEKLWYQLGRLWIWVRQFVRVERVKVPAAEPEATEGQAGDGPPAPTDPDDTSSPAGPAPVVERKTCERCGRVLEDVGVCNCTFLPEPDGPAR